MFTLTEQELERVAAWERELDAVTLERQRETLVDFELLTCNGKYPYYGAIGGSLTYSFTPTSIGTFVSVRHSPTNEVLELTDYSDW